MKGMTGWRNMILFATVLLSPYTAPHMTMTSQADLFCVYFQAVVKSEFEEDFHRVLQLGSIHVHYVGGMKMREWKETFCGPSEESLQTQ